MNKFKLFIDNFMIYGLGGIISKVIPLIMVPIVTRLMPTTDYYGVSDLSNTVVQLASALAVMGMYDAMYRMFFEREEFEYKRKVCSTALIFSISMSLVVFGLLLLLKEQVARYFFSSEKYSYIVYLSAMAVLVGATNSIISAPTRMQNKRKIFLITNAISPLISYGIAIPMLLLGYYTVALPLAMFISGMIMEITFGIINRRWFCFKEYDWKLLKELLIIALPLLPNFMIYWIFNSCDRVMITNLMDIGASGIYSVGSKLGHCSQLIYSAFAGGWQFFAFSTMKEKNQVQNNSMIFEYLGIISFFSTTIICAFSYQIFNLLFTEEYMAGYIIAPYLFLAPLLQMLFQVAANQFLVVKKTWPNMLILLSGAIVNIAVNYILIPVIGIEGASLATLMGYFISDIICVIVLCRMKLMIISNRFLFLTIGLMAYMAMWRFLFNSNWIIGIIAAILYWLIIIILYKKDIKGLVDVIKKKNK